MNKFKNITLTLISFIPLVGKKFYLKCLIYRSKSTFVKKYSLAINTLQKQLKNLESILKVNGDDFKEEDDGLRIMFQRIDYAAKYNILKVKKHLLESIKRLEENQAILNEMKPIYKVFL